jgi:NAD(P)-dependent dehydrogenase (short-subunit alcohol dehydrogenase family)
MAPMRPRRVTKCHGSRNAPLGGGAAALTAWMKAVAGRIAFWEDTCETGEQRLTGRLDNKVAIVTGAGCVGPGWGNGRAAAVLFAREGASIFAVDRNPDAMSETIEEVRKVGGTIHAHACDVTDSAAVAQMVAACTAAFGRIDVLLNNVGGSAPGGPVELSEEAWDAQVDLNLKSVFLACKHVLPVMERQRSGAIVNTASTSGIRWTGSAQVAYAATKAGVIQFSRVVAVQYAAKGIRVNTIVPGQMHTPMVEARLAKQRAGGDVEALLEQRLARIPLGFAGDGRDTAAAALFLASDEARFITGTEIVVDGGMSARCD